MSENKGDKFYIGYGREMDADDYLREVLCFYGDDDMTTDRYREAFRMLVQILNEKGILNADDVERMKP